MRWNEPYQKLASCDSKGVIYVWVKYEGRWSIELINDRGNSVSDFAWSHDGKMAAICYQDGFVLVGSVNGQRFWSHLYDLPNSTITCATWAPNDNFVLIGLSNGSLMVVDEHGTILTRHYLKNDSILSVQYNAPKFFQNHEDILNQQTDDNYSLIHNNRLRLSANINDHLNMNFNSTQSTKNNKINNNNYIIACLLKTSGNIYLLKTYDDLDPVIIDTQLESVKLEWSNCGKYLAVGGCEPQTNNTNKPNNFVHFYNQNGILIYKIKVPLIKNENILNKNSVITKLENKLKSKQSKNEIQQMFSAMTWGHNDSRLFVACSSTLHILRVFKEIPKFSLLTQISIKNSLKESNEVDHLNLPNRLKEQIKYCYMSSIKSVYPKLSKLRKFVCSSLPNNERLHCTLKCLNIDNKNYDDYYVLYLEYLGGLIPLLTARKSSKLRPNFVIFDPFLITKTKQKNKLKKIKIKSSSDTDLRIEETSDKKNANKRKIIAKRMSQTKKMKKSLKKRLLVEIRSNIWGTKFEFIGQSCLPNSIGQIVYKTSLFHLQPRQMKISLDDLTPTVNVQPIIPKLIPKRAIVKSNTFDPSFSNNKNMLKLNKLSIQRVTSATLGAIPSPNAEDEERVINTSLKTKYNDFSGQQTTNLNDLTNCNERISTVQQLIENKFDKNDNFFKSNSFNLPILSLTNNHNENSVDFESNEYLFTSQTNDLQEELNDDETNLIDTTTTTTATTPNRRTSLLNFYSKLQLNQSKFNLLNRLNNKNGEFIFASSSNFLNFFRTNSTNGSLNSNSLNNKNTKRLIDEYQKLDDSNFNSIKIKTNKAKTLLNKTDLGLIKNELDDQDLVDLDEGNLSDNEKLVDLKSKKTNSNSNRQFILHNKPPIWNETNQVYQLDFGGRVTQESAKNFQIEFGGKQVMQFGRIDSNAYTLDFEWPFTAVQAFSIALANITQRLK